MKDVQFIGLSKTFTDARGKPVEALKDIHLTFPDGGVTCIVGASGCGKSTLLRIVAGLDPVYEGTVQLGGQPILRPGLDRGIVFQDHRLVPWMTVRENVALALHRLAPRAREAIVREKLALVGLEGFAHTYPAQLSGGMAQRVAIARALAHQPGVLLMDEPFGALDPLTRDALGDDYRALHDKLGLTTVMITHDMTEAILLADRVAVMRFGKLLAQGTPAYLSASSDPYVGELMRTPRRQAERLALLLGTGAT